MLENIILAVTIFQMIDLYLGIGRSPVPVPLGEEPSPMRRLW